MQSMEYQKHIVSNEKMQSFLHRTSKTLIDIIMQEGLVCGEGDLLSTTTWQPQDLESAEKIYLRPHKNNDAIIVIKIPTIIINSIPKIARNSIALKKGIGYLHPKKTEFVIKPEHVFGWINKENNAYYPNPYEERKPAKGFEEFENMLD